MKVSVGNKVKIIDEDFEGRVKEVLQNNRFVITCTDGFDYEFPSHKVVIIGDDNQHLYSIDQTDFSTKIASDKYLKADFLKRYTSKSRFQISGTLEVDLHLEQLVEYPNKLDDWQRLHTQMQHVKNCLSAAHQKNIRQIVFIHGVGTGVLKTELLNYLSKRDNLTITEADFNSYGNGATKVLIKS